MAKEEAKVGIEMDCLILQGSRGLIGQEAVDILI